MEKDILVILMMAFGLFAILMFILFYIYVKKYYNAKHLTENYQSEDEECELVDIMINDNIVTFDANNYILNTEEQVKVVMDNHIYNGIVKRENYNESINNIVETPRLLVLDTKKEEKVEDNSSFEDVKLYNSINETKLVEEEPIIYENNDFDETEFIPKKKT